MNQTKDENVFTHKHLVSQREPELNLDFHSFFFSVVPVVCESFPGRDRTCATATIQATAVTTLDT